MSPMRNTSDKAQKFRKLVLRFLVVFLLPSLLAAQSSPSRPSEKIDQMIQALGGKTFLDVTDIHTTGRFFGFSKGELNASDLFSDYVKFPDMERTEFGSKVKTITINRGKEGSKVEGKKESAQQSPGEVEEFLAGFKTSFDYVTRFVLKERQTAIQNVSTEIIDFKRADVVEVRDSAKNLIRFYIDRDSHLPLKM